MLALSNKQMQWETNLRKHKPERYLQILVTVNKRYLIPEFAWYRCLPPHQNECRHVDQPGKRDGSLIP